MKNLMMILGVFLYLCGNAWGAATERGFTIQYQEPTQTACLPATTLQPASAPAMCLEAMGNHTEQKTCDAASNQKFAMVPTPTAGLFQLKSRTSGLCLRMGANLNDAIIETSCANAAAGGGGAQDQIFRIGPSPSAIQSNTGAGGLCLDVASAGTVDGTKIMAYTCHGGANQSWAYALDAGGNCPLDDLAGTKIYMDVISDGIVGTVDTVPPSSKTGGGLISKRYCVPILDTATAKTIEIEVSAFDIAGNESVKTPKLIHPVEGTRDCTLPPSPNCTEGTTIVDSLNREWTLGPANETLRDGVRAGSGTGTPYLFALGEVYVLAGLVWYHWDESLGVDDPGWVAKTKTKPACTVVDITAPAIPSGLAITGP